MGVARFLYRCQEQRLWRLGFYPLFILLVIITLLLEDGIFCLQTPQ